MKKNFPPYCPQKVGGDRPPCPSANEGPAFGATWKDPGGGFIKFTVTRALKQDQIVHMEEKLQVILYFRVECHRI